MVGAAVASAPFAALLAFRLIHPPSAGRRRAALAGAMVREVEAMAARPGALRRAPVWRARLHHRLLRLLRWSERSGAGIDEAAAGGVAFLLVGRAVLVLEGRLADPVLSGSARRRLRLARARCATLGDDPVRAADALAAAARLGGGATRPCCRQRRGRSGRTPPSSPGPRREPASPPSDAGG